MSASVASWQQYIQTTMELGFNKVTIVNRKNYETLASSSATDIASEWKVYDNVAIDENDELSADWGMKTIFYFYRKKFRVVMRSTDHDMFRQKTMDELKRTIHLSVFGYIHNMSISDNIPDEIGNLICFYVDNIEYKPKKECKYIVSVVGFNGKEIIVAFQFKRIWFVAYTSDVGTFWARYKNSDRPKFFDAKHAWNTISTKIFDAMQEADL